MIKNSSHSIRNIHLSRNPCRNPRIWWENESAKKNPFLTTTCHNLKLVGCICGCIWRKKFPRINDWMNRRPKCLNLDFFSGKTHENYKTPSVITGMGPRWQDLGHEDIKKNHQHFESSWKNPKSKNCSPELNIGRSETNEDSTSM